jgi:excisionase family DNA binding protein
MNSIRPGITGRRSRVADDQFEPLVVSPREACRLLSIGNTHLYDLIAKGEVESYLDGRARRITMESIRRRIARLLATARDADVQVAPPRRLARPRKLPASEA